MKGTVLSYSTDTDRYTLKLTIPIASTSGGGGEMGSDGGEEVTIAIKPGNLVHEDPLVEPLD